MIILIEGNEGVGKTTLINELLEKITITTLKSSKNFKGLYTLYRDLAKSPQLFVLDRGFLTDIVYRIWDNKQGQLSLYQIGILCSESSNIKIVMCHNFNGFENAVKRGENVVRCQKDYDRIDQIYEDAVRVIRNFTDIEVYDYNYEYQTVDDVIDFIKGGKHE